MYKANQSQTDPGLNHSYQIQIPPPFIQEPQDLPNEQNPKLENSNPGTTSSNFQNKPISTFGNPEKLTCTPGMQQAEEIN